MITILIYLLLRLFVPKKNYYLEGDEVRHLATARNFYKLWNNSTYDMHPPLYSWLVKYLKSGVVVSFLCSIGLFFVSSAIYDELGLTYPQKTMALTFLAFNYTLIYYSNRIFRYQLIAFLGTLTIYLLLIHNWIAAGFAWGLLGLTCTFAGLRGIFTWGLLSHNLITLAIFIKVFIVWLMTKARIYCTHDYYPSGIEGKIEKVYPFTLRQLFSPFYFDWTYYYEGRTQLAYSWPKKIGGVFGLYKPLGFLVPVALFFTIKGMFSAPLWLNILVICLLYPALLKRFNARNSIAAIPLIGFLLAKGLPQVPVEWLFLVSSFLLVGFLCFQRASLFTKPKIKGLETSKYIDSLPLDGVMAEGLISHFIAYGTDKRVVIIPHERGLDIKQTLLSIKEFDLNYAVISDIYKQVYKSNTYPALEFIAKYFDLLEIIKEDGNVYYVYQVPKGFKPIKRQDEAEDKSRFCWSRETRYN